MVQWIVSVLAIVYLKVIWFVLQFLIWTNQFGSFLWLNNLTLKIFPVPPAYNVAAQRALLHRLGRAHSHEGVTSSISISQAPLGYYQPNNEDTGKCSFFSVSLLSVCVKCHNILSLVHIYFQMMMVHKYLLSDLVVLYKSKWASNFSTFCV